MNSWANDVQALAPLGIPLVSAFYDFPMAYNGRNGGVVLSGTDVVRPIGLYPPSDGQRARLQPCQKLDFEIELAFFISSPLPKGKNHYSQRSCGAHIRIRGPERLVSTRHTET